MVGKMYKNIIKKLRLSRSELEDLKNRLQSDKVSVGPFQSGGMMCPNTNALAIKHRVNHFSDNAEIRKFFYQHDIGQVELWKFYILFDLPAKFSKSYKEKSLSAFRKVIDELASE